MNDAQWGATVNDKLVAADGSPKSATYVNEDGVGRQFIAESTLDPFGRGAAASGQACWFTVTAPTPIFAPGARPRPRRNAPRGI